MVPLCVKRRRLRVEACCGWIDFVVLFTPTSLPIYQPKQITAMADEEVDWGVDELNETNGVVPTADEDVLSLGGEADEGMLYLS